MLSSLCLLLVALVGVSVQQCTIEGFQNITLDTIQATEATDASQLFTINRTIYNCLSTSQTIGVYDSMSVSILYIRSDTPNQMREVRYNMRCSSNTWGRIGQQSDALISSDTRRNCSDCTNQTVNDYHCTPCDSSCTGLNQCYGPMADQCCSYNDGGNCVADCGMNREGDATFQCVCSNFWIGSNCDVCSLNCMNGGTPQSDCSTCQCAPGYNGTVCDVNIDECASSPCENGGSCTDGINSYNCTCVAGYTGDNCETNIDDCASSPCENGGNCTDGINSYTCACVAGYTGDNCETNINDCASSPCENGGNCTDGINSYTCACVAGYTGNNCQANIDDCSPNPCQNGGRCTDGVNSYNCTCVDGYNGSNCDNDVDDCSPNPCQNEATCNDGINSYTCTCVEGYNGTDCENDIDECSSNPCQNGSCTDGINSYTCTCIAGYTGNNCEANIDECSSNPCQYGGTCTDLINDYSCRCNPVYSGRNCNDCAMLNCEQCRESSENVMGECTKCVGVFVLDKGTCNDNCRIPNCIVCDKVDMKCIQCQAGYRENNNGGCSEEIPKEEGQDDDELDSGSIAGIVIACLVAALLIIILTIFSVIALYRDRKKRKGKADFKSGAKYRKKNVQDLPNPAFKPDTEFDAKEEKVSPVKDDDVTMTDGGQDEKESLKEEVIGTIV